MGNFDKDGDSSFSYTSFFGGCKLLVIVPHQDDEINVAGSTIIGSIAEGLDVSLAFMTMVTGSMMYHSVIMKQLMQLKY